jgi:glucose/arabinose dehydrogenase
MSLEPILSFRRKGLRAPIVLSLLSLLSCVPVAVAQPDANAHLRYYSVETVPTPPGVGPSCGGLSFLPDGRLVAVFDHGEVYFYTPSTRHWVRFAEGMHTPLGVMAVNAREVLVAQRSELTRLVDSTGSGMADRYECISDAWGLSGNYDEFTFGPAMDSKGNLYVALGLGSGGGKVRYEIRGRFNPDGSDFGVHAATSGVPYRGWVVKISPDGNMVPVACGLREPNGIMVDSEDRVFVTDNQGDWVGTSPLYHILPGEFYGHPSSIVWRPDWHGPPSVLELDKMRRDANVLFSHGIIANSPGQPIIDPTRGRFGPFAGQMFVTEFNVQRLVRVMLEEVAGDLQGAVAPFFDGPPLRSGNIRLAFAPDGSLWVGQGQRRNGWPAEEGIQKITWTGETPMDVLSVHLTDTGFEFTFTKPTDPGIAAHPEAFAGKRYYYLYHHEYGSPRIDVHKVGVSHLVRSPDGLKVTFDADVLQAGEIYEFSLDKITAADGTRILNPLVAYTATHLRDGSSRPIPWPAPTGDAVGTGNDQPRIPNP